MSCSKSPMFLRWLCSLCHKAWGSHLRLSAISDGMVLGPTALTSEIMLPLMIFQGVSCICLLCCRERVQNNADHICYPNDRTKLNWSLVVILLLIPRDSTQQSSLPWSFSHRITVLYTHVKCVFCAPTAQCLHLNLTLDSCLFPSRAQSQCLIHLWVSHGNSTQGGHIVTLKEELLQGFK